MIAIKAKHGFKCEIILMPNFYLMLLNVPPVFPLYNKICTARK